MSLTPNQFADQLREGLRQIQTNNRPLFLAARSSLANLSKRIFDSGLSVDGGRLGNYNTTEPVYMQPNQMPQKRAGRGKNGNTKFANGQPHKTTYYESYKAFREDMGRRTDTIIADLFGHLRLDMQNPQPTRNETGKIEPTFININEYQVQLKYPESVIKKRNLEKRFGSIFKLSESEKQEFFEILEKELAKIFTP